MDKKTKIKKLLAVLKPDATQVDFADFDKKVKELQTSLKEKIQVQTLDDVKGQLDKFQKKIDFTPLSDSVQSIEEGINVKLEAISQAIDEELATLKSLIDSRDSEAKGGITQVNENIKLLEAEYKGLDLKKTTDIAELKDRIRQLSSIADTATQAISGLKDVLEESRGDVNVIRDDLQAITSSNINSLEKLRQELSNRINNIRVGGGNQNRNITVEGRSVLGKFTDINLYGTTTSLITSVNNSKGVVNIGIPAGGGGGGTWGSITGTLSDQTDLQTALDAKQNDITGADTRVLFFDGANNPAGDAGLTYNKTTDTVSLVGNLDFGATGTGGIVGYGGSTIKFSPDAGQNAVRFTPAGGSNYWKTFNSGANLYFQFVPSAGATVFDSYAAALYLGVTGGSAIVIDTNNLVGIGHASPSAQLHVVKTTEQYRVGYDTSNYWKTTVSSNGSTTFDLVGTSPEFTFSDPVNVPDEAYGAGWNGSLEVPTKNAVYDKIESLTGGGITRTSSTISVNTTGGTSNNTDYVYFTNVGITFNLPSVAGLSNNQYTVKNMANSSVLVVSSEGIDGSATALITGQYQSLTFNHNGSVYGVV